MKLVLHVRGGGGSNCSSFPLVLFSALIFPCRGGRDDSAFSNSSIISDLRDQITQLQSILKEKEDAERTSAQKLATYQSQLHIKNEEVASLKDQLQAKVGLV